MGSVPLVAGTATGGDSDRGRSGTGAELEADWRERLAAAGRGQEQELRRCTYGGTPFGSEAFVSEMEQRSGQRLRPKPPGPEPGSKHGLAAAG